MIEPQQLIGRRGRHDAPRRQGGSRGCHRIELPSGIDVAVVGIDERRGDARSRRGIPFRVTPDRAVSGLLAMRRRRQRRFCGRWIAQRMLVGDEVVGNLGGVRRQSRLRPLRCAR